MASKENKSYAQLSIDQPAHYRIRIKGELEVNWSDRLGGMKVDKQTQEDGSIVSILEGQLVDQAALFGVLVALYNMRLPLIAVECLDIERDDENPLLKVRVEQRPDYLEFIVSGVQDAVSIPEPLETILNSCELAGQYRVLVDFRGLTGGDNQGPVIEYAKGVIREYQEYLNMGGKPLKVAVLGRGDAMEAWKVGEGIVRGHGLEALMSTDYEEAVAWLKSDKNGQLFENQRK